ncbi:hypothetical protein IWW52_005126 [Coemansia sp. RSA 2704]|nr:hypothetical protein IWW52_005126 [Coemansia sp. RSA 2704]
MKLLRFVLLLLCLVLTVRASTEFEERKGGGGGGGGHGGGGHGSSGGHGSGGKPSGGGSKPGSSSSKGPNSGISTGSKGGGGSSGKGSGSYGDRPPSYASLFPNRSGFNAGGRATGTGDSTHAYGPPPAYTANAHYTTVNRGQTVAPYTFNSKSPAVYYASTSRSQYPGAWGYGYYPIYPYPWWAYGAGYWAGSTYHTNSTTHGVNKYSSELRNTTVVNATNIPLIGDQDIFNNTNNITFTDFNNGSIRIAPCGNKSSSALQVSASDCDIVVLDIRFGRVLSGHASVTVQNETTFFQLSLGNRTTTLRTQTISSTKKKGRGGIIAGIVLGVVGFVVLCVVGACLLVRYKRRRG